MSENMDMPQADTPGKKNTTLIIIIVVVLVLCCCCAIAAGLAWQFGDAILYEMGIY